MAYTNVQFIGYVLDTLPQTNPDGSETCLGLGDPSLDTEARCGLMLRAMQTAAEALAQTSPSAAKGETLKVFMAPEYFFRGPTGAYQMDDVRCVVASLQRMVAEAQWVDWVFVFGTVVGAPAIASTAQTSDTNPLAYAEAYNYVLVQQGGVATQGDAGVGAVTKALMSGVAAIASAAHPGGVLVGDALQGAVLVAGGWGRDPRSVAYDRAGVFELAGMTWGLEVGPHPRQKEPASQRSPQLPGDKLIQLQVVPSCGTGIQASSIIAQDGGFVFNCDGAGAASRSMLVQNVPPVAAQPMLSSTPVSGAPIALTGTSPVLDVAISALYAGGPGVVNVYAVQPVPASQVVPGKTVRLDWAASADYSFVFHLVYNSNGIFATVVCEVRSKRVSFYGNHYFLPLSLQTQDVSQQSVCIQMKLGPGSSPYAGAVWCKIMVPGFVFEGNAFEFSAMYGDPEPRTVWAP